MSLLFGFEKPMMYSTCENPILLIRALVSYLYLTGTVLWPLKWFSYVSKDVILTVFLFYRMSSRKSKCLYFLQILHTSNTMISSKSLISLTGKCPLEILKGILLVLTFLVISYYSSFKLVFENYIYGKTNLNKSDNEKSLHYVTISRGPNLRIRDSFSRTQPHEFFSKIWCIWSHFRMGGPLLRSGQIFYGPKIVVIGKTVKAKNG